MQSWDKECGPDICAQVVALAEDFLLRQNEPESEEEKVRDLGDTE